MDEKKRKITIFFFHISCFFTQITSLESANKSSGGRGTREHGEKERRRQRERERETFVASGGF